MALLLRSRRNFTRTWNRKRKRMMEEKNTLSFHATSLKWMNFGLFSRLFLSFETWLPIHFPTNKLCWKTEKKKKKKEEEHSHLQPSTPSRPYSTSFFFIWMYGYKWHRTTFLVYFDFTIHESNSREKFSAISTATHNSLCPKM